MPSKFDLYNFELYHFKVDTFFLRHGVVSNVLRGTKF